MVKGIKNLKNLLITDFIFTIISRCRLDEYYKYIYSSKT